MSKINLQKTNENQILNIELNFPEKNNILSLEMISDLKSAFKVAYEDSNIKTVIMSAKGRHFCTGGDLKWMLINESMSDSENENQISSLFDLFYQIDKCPVPVIGLIHGATYGGGLGLVSVCDIAVATSDAKFCFSEIKLSLIPSTIAPFILKKMSFSKAKSLMLSGEVFGTSEALKENLIHFVGDKNLCESYISDLKDHFIKTDRKALSGIKNLLNSISHISVEDAKKHSVKSLKEIRKSSEAIKCISEFLKSKK